MSISLFGFTIHTHSRCKCSHHKCRACRFGIGSPDGSFAPCKTGSRNGRVGFENVFIVFVAGLPRKPKLPFADWYSTYARSFSKAACSFPTRKNCALLPIASAILQNGAIRFVWQSLPPHQSTPVPTKQMPYPCNHRQQGFFVSHQDYPARVLMPKDNF